MVDSHQVLIDNCNGNDSEQKNLTANAISMNEIHLQQQQNSELNGSNNLKIVENNCEKYGKSSHKKKQLLDNHGKIMCGSSPKRELSNDDSPNCTNATQPPRPYPVTQNVSDDANLITSTDIESQTTNTNHDGSSVNNNNNQRKINKTNDSKNCNKDLTTTKSSTENSVKFQSNVTFSVKNCNNITNKMDSRKVEPIRININRDPIKTKIKLGPSSHDCQAVSLKTATTTSSSSSSSNNSNNDDECDNISDVITHENTQNYPKITIKPIVKPAINNHNNQNVAGLQASSSSSLSLSSSSTSHEAIPKIKIKKIEPSSSSSASNQTSKPTLVAALNSDEITTNYQTHLLSESSTTVPTSATIRSSTNNPSIGGLNCSSDENLSASNEIIPKLTIKLDNHNQHNSSSDSPRNSVQTPGVKLTLKQVSEPPIPKFTITNAFNDTAKVVMLNNNEQTDESSDELPSQPPSNQPSPSGKTSTRNDYVTHTITSTSSSYSGTTAEDNLSTCSSSSTSSYSSSSSLIHPNNDIKLIIKATSSGNCVVSPNPASVVRNSPSSVGGKSTSSTKVSSSSKNNTAAADEQTNKLNNITSNVVTSSTLTANDSIPKLNIKLSNTDYPQVIHNEISANECNSSSSSSKNELNRTESPLPKLTIRIPKPAEKPLEIVTTGLGSPFRTTDNESQQSPRIILKINKNTTSQAKESSSTLTSTTIIASDDFQTTRSDSPQLTAAKQNELKRSNYDASVAEISAKKQKLNDIDNIQLLSSDSEYDDKDQQSISNKLDESHEELNENEMTTLATELNNLPTDSFENTLTTASTASNLSHSFNTNSGLRSILSRPQMKIQPPPQTLQSFLQTIPPFKSTTATATAVDAAAAASHKDTLKLNDVIDLCHDSNDQIDESLLNDDDELLSHKGIKEEISNQMNAAAIVNENVTTKQPNSGDQNSKNSSSYNWQCFYNNSTKEPAQEPVHPLLQQNIERANVLAAMMEAANKQENENDNNNSAAILEQQTNNSNELLFENEGSSSDCIVIEDTETSEPFACEFASRTENLSAELNGSNKKECVDRDSGVDVSNSVKSMAEDDSMPTVKRPRGRPRKGNAIKTIVNKKRDKIVTSKRKFADFTMVQETHAMTTNVEINTIEDAFMIKSDEELPETLLSDAPNDIQTTSIIPKSPEQNLGGTISLSESPINSETNSLTAANITTTATATTAITTKITESIENLYDCNVIESPVESVSLIKQSQDDVSNDVLMDTTLPIEQIKHTPATEISPLVIDSPALVTPTTPSVPKERKRRIIIDDDDESPTFNPQRSNKKLRGKNRRNKHNLMLKKQKKAALLLSTPSSSTSFIDKANENAVFTSPEVLDRRKPLNSGASGLQVFEEDTRMSADSLFTSPTMRSTEFLNNEESQSSLHSSTSATVENSTKKIRSKIEVVDPEGRTEFTVDMIAEYDWPPPKGCCPSRNRDTFMVQEQIAEYLGVKSFKRKYPDLPRRMVEMEERNYLLEKGLVSEKMCDLGLTAVLASDVLDIMNNDFYEKYEEYRRYLREKQIRDLTARHKQVQAGVHGKSMSARENAMRAASMWNTEFNRTRNDSRRECLDLQNFVIQTSDFYRKQQNRPKTKASNYPVALVPGQYQDYYRKYNPAELLCYPINTVLADPHQLDQKLRDYYNRISGSQCNSDDESSSDNDSLSDSDSESSDDSDDSSSSSDDLTDIEDDSKKTDISLNELLSVPVPKIDKAQRNECQICSGPERCNAQKKPEIFVGCVTCKRNAHPSCLKMSAKMVRRTNEYAWQCKKCNKCIKCQRKDNEDKMLFCNQCDRSYHIYCIGLRKIPNGNWHCAVCTVCTLCGARRPEGHNNPNLTPQQKQKLLAVAKWTHEYQENVLTKEQEHVSMLCTSCIALKHSTVKTTISIN